MSTQQTAKQTPVAASANYRLPRNFGQPSIYLRMVWNGQEAIMTGGKGGDHRITTTDLARLRAHWAGYVSNNRGRTVKPFITVVYANAEGKVVDMYTVIDLTTDTSHGDYATLDEARGCVAYDRLTSYSIWHGDCRVECCDGYRGSDDRAKQGMGLPNASEGR